MVGSSSKPLKTAEELCAELEWAAHTLTGDASGARILFALPTLASHDQPNPEYNWDVEVSCRPDQDEAAQAAIVHVANKWNLAAPRVSPAVPAMANREDRSAVPHAAAANGAVRAGASRGHGA